ncbi:hypothetical protein [Streptomyces sp. NPDC059788]|uniref:hypothetical protein n=1 Tax=Streptomyces sp. NPDC059788 TaxID=3346948 RepID=UPI00365F5DC4
MTTSRATWAAAGAALLLLSGAPSAQAAPGQVPAVRYANSVSDDLGTLQVAVGSDSAITEIKAHIVSAATQQEVATVGGDRFALFSGTSTDGVWRTKEPLRLPALGSYTVSVEATDADGDHTVENSAGFMSYFVAAQFENFRTDRSRIDTDHRDVRVEGVLKGRWPGTRELKPLPDRPVDIDVDAVTTGATPRTDAQGRFSAVVRLDNAAGIRAVHRPDAAGVIYGESPAAQITVRQVPTRWSRLRTTDRTVNYGQQVTLTAMLERRTPKGWVPFGGQHGGALFAHPSGGQFETVGQFTTAEDGTVTLTHAPAEYGHFELTSRSDDPFIAEASGQSLDIAVLRASRFTSFKAVRTDAHQVNVQGDIDFPDGRQPATIDVRIQVSRDGKSWADAATVEARWSGSGNAFSADIARSGTSYFRAFFRSTGIFQSAASAPVRVAG